ncbi:fumarylacetoacetate hydrolase family protein [Paenibacillus sp. 7516]|uniref:fumarylacetoacetate hydrolase family protein n=1 Tax=Paenibacillus sp. 7516 TaxID=2022549 RepID=UPI000BA56A4A|nr:fumarylacetoacetate hydrolase family protein [Paenibacillus sp. 7516]PAF33311.1 fumarylacetoacetate hydrolase [Paenibacillus sp. 7516]
MKLVSVKHGDGERAAIEHEERFFFLEEINRAEGSAWGTSIMEILQQGQLEELIQWYQKHRDRTVSSIPFIPSEGAIPAPLFRHPRKIWGIGMNYVQKAIDLGSTPPEREPVCFMKPDSSLIGPEEYIQLTTQDVNVTSEAELGIIIGRTCKNVPEEHAQEVIAGFAATQDMTNQDIHARNPRFLQRSKVSDTFFSLGPQLITPDEIGDLQSLVVETVLNDEVIHSNTVSRMMYHPWFIVSYFSQMMTLYPGDVIMTGTPGSVRIQHGDVAECRISGFMTLRNPVAEVE